MQQLYSYCTVTILTVAMLKERSGYYYYPLLSFCSTQSFIFTVELKRIKMNENILIVYILLQLENKINTDVSGISYK